MNFPLAFFNCAMRNDAESLAPSHDLELNTVNGAVLTTYAGLLLRELLDHYHGNVPEALAAYNGGTTTPNLRYAFEVAGIAEYARHVLEHAPMLHASDPTKATATTPVHLARALATHSGS